MVLKHSALDALLSRKGTLSAAERQEMTYLRSRVSHEQMSDILKQQLPYLDARLFAAYMRSLQQNCPFWIRAKAGRYKAV